jgi:hypothetical protein
MTHNPHDFDVELQDWLASEEDGQALADVAGRISRFAADKEPSLTMAARVRQQASPKRLSSLRHKLLRSAVAAGLLLAGAGIGYYVNQSPARSEMAWGDVVQAMRQVDHFHVTAFADEPRNAGDPKMFRLDVFYQHPGRFRAQGLEHVEFVADGKTTLYSVAEKKFVDPAAAGATQLVPAAFIDRLRRDDVLSAVLATMFHGDPPAGAPVKGPEESAGIEVFDYVTDAKIQWARVWVMKESRLPIRVKIFQPGSDSFLLAEFDYSDPQPAAFFNPTAFTQQLERDHPTDAQRVYSMGAELVKGRLPQTGDQIHLVQGKLKVPTIRKVRAANNGDIVMVTNSARSYTPDGNQADINVSGDIQDSWGNRYVPVTWVQEPDIGDETQRMWFFTPLAKFHAALGDRTLTIHFATRYPDQAPVGTVNAPVPAANDAALAEEFKEYLSAEQKGYAFWNYMQEHEIDSAEQLVKADELLAQSPQSLAANLWKFDLIRRDRSAGEGDAFFETHLRDRLLSGQQLFGSIGRNSMAMGQYLYDLYASGRDEKAQKLLDQLLAVREAALKSKYPKRAVYSFDNNFSLLHKAMQIPNRLAQFEVSPKPTVGQVWAGKDGIVAVELMVPTVPQWAGRDGGSQDNRPPEAVWAGNPLADGAFVTRRAYDPARHCVWIAFKSDKHVVTLSDTVSIATDLARTGQAASETDLSRKWSLKVEVPAATVDSIEQWWKQNVLNGQ